METISFKLAKHIAKSINELMDKDLKEAREVGLPYDPFYYAIDILKIVDDFNETKGK